MNPLAKQFKRDQFSFEQVMDLHPVYVYQKAKGDWMGWEVIIARERAARVINGRVIEAGWAYPSSEDWGTLGWSLQSMGQARDKALAVVKLLIQSAAEKQQKV